MTRDETKQVLMVIQVAYPNYHPQDKTVAVDLWHSMLGDYEYQSVILGVQAYIATDKSGFAPSIGQVIDKLDALLNKDTETGMEAWSMVSKAIRRSIFYSKEEFDSLPPDVQRAVGSADQLHHWALDSNYNESVVMSQFLKSYQAVHEQSKERQRLPDSVKRLMDDTSNKLNG